MKLTKLQIISAIVILIILSFYSGRLSKKGITIVKHDTVSYAVDTSTNYYLDIILAYQDTLKQKESNIDSLKNLIHVKNAKRDKEISYLQSYTIMQLDSIAFSGSYEGRYNMLQHRRSEDIGPE